jgi:hypothetical protein
MTPEFVLLGEAAGITLTSVEQDTRSGAVPVPFHRLLRAGCERPYNTVQVRFLAGSFSAGGVSNAEATEFWLHLAHARLCRQRPLASPATAR